MTWRVFRFFLFQVVGAALGYAWLPLANDYQATIAGIMGASMVWVFVDLRRGHKLLLWLREGDAAKPPVIAGYWGEIADRTRRLMRRRDLLVGESETRLQDFLSAIQASPNGVMLLDPQGRIE